MGLRTYLYVVALIIATLATSIPIGVLAYKSYCGEWKEDSGTSTLTVEVSHNGKTAATVKIKLWAYVGAYDNGLYLYDIDHRASLTKEVTSYEPGVDVKFVFKWKRIDYPPPNEDKSTIAFTIAELVPEDGHSKCLLIIYIDGREIDYEIPCFAAAAEIESGSESSGP